MGVVHLLQPVEVDGEDGHHTSVASEGLDALLELRPEAAPIGEAGELIVMRELAQARVLQLELHEPVAELGHDVPGQAIHGDG
jgi:hypothetical protein